MKSTMTSEMIQTARMTGVTYRSEDYRVVVVLNGDRAVFQTTDGMGWTADAEMSVESAWCVIARRGLNLAGHP